MARICAVCDKRPQVGYNVSHAKNRTKKWIYPNVQKMRFMLRSEQGTVQRGKVCTKCVKAGKVIKYL